MGQAVQCQNGRGADGLLKSGVSYNLVRKRYKKLFVIYWYYS